MKGKIKYAEQSETEEPYVSASSWDQFAAGDNCPFDGLGQATDDYKDFVAKLSISSLYLGKNQTYRGACGLIFNARHVISIDQLNVAEWNAFSADLFVAHTAIVRTMRPDHTNVMLLGNTIPHLHWGIVPRYKNDPRWGQSIFTTTRAEMADVRLPAEEQRTLIVELRESLTVHGHDI